jgi:hypothetical protein
MTLFGVAAAADLRLIPGNEAMGLTRLREADKLRALLLSSTRQATTGGIKGADNQITPPAYWKFESIPSSGESQTNFGTWVIEGQGGLSVGKRVVDGV